MTQPYNVYLEGMVGLGTIRFTATVAHGRGTREVTVDVPPELILRLADALRATRGDACATKNSRPAGGDPSGFHVGHAVWHVKHPDAPMPCIDHGGVLDIVDAALSLGEGK